MNALIITNTTAVRMNVIADRTQNLLIAGAKAMMIESLKEKLRSGVAHFIYIKRMVRCVRHGERPQRVWLKSISMAKVAAASRTAQPPTLILRKGLGAL